MSILDRFRLDDHAAVVTGAGRGIGAATAIALAEAGADVLISARHEDQLEHTAEQIRARGRRAIVVPADLRDLTQAKELTQKAFDEFGRIDTIVNNVGGAPPKPFEHTSEEHLEKAFHFNVSTAHALTRAALPYLLKSETAAVISISSVMGRSAARGYLAYGTAKAGLAHWTRLAATDLAPTIRVNAVVVGSVMTSALEFVAGVPEMMEQMERNTPLGRVGEADDVAAAVLYLASPAARYVTGKLIEVDGGIQQPNLDLGLPDITV